MLLFQDIGFDLLSKNSVQSTMPLISSEIEPPVVPTPTLTSLPVIGTHVEPVPSNGNQVGAIFFILLITASLLGVVYMVSKHSRQSVTYKEPEA